MRDIDETRWYLFHFDGDPAERESIRLTWEIFKTLAVILFAVFVLMLAGCASNARPYGEVFIAKDLGGDLPSCNGENAGVRVGVESRTPIDRLTWAVEWEHISHLTCGRPFNDKLDTYADHVGITLKYGGIQ